MDCIKYPNCTKIKAVVEWIFIKRKVNPFVYDWNARTISSDQPCLGLQMYNRVRMRPQLAYT